MRAAPLLALALLLGGAASAAAQPVTCNLVRREGGEAIISNAGQPTEFGIIYRAHFLCDGGRSTMIADTATYSRASGQIELFGRVEVSNPDQVMRSARATYFTQLRQLSASGNVRVTDRETGSTLRGDLLNYLEQTPDRPESQMTATATTGLARAVLLRERAAEPGVRDTTVVDAAQIHIVGDRLFRGLGNAVMTRDSLRATGATIEYSQQDGAMQVNGDGRIELPGYELRGDSISATLGEDDEIREVLARHAAALSSEDLQVTGPALRLFFEDGGVHRLVAMSWRPRSFGPEPGRPLAWSDEFRMEADSLDVLAPAQRLTEAVAIGVAHVERITPDSLRALLPEVAPDVLALIGNDWMRGDTVRAFFADGPQRHATDPAAREPAEGAVTDTATAEPERVLERIWTTGDPASTMHRTRDENAPDGTKLSIAYLVGREVEVVFSNGTVSVVSASDDVRGVYLQPAEVARRTGGGTAVIPPEQQ
jgi:lipopolysaccharide export system protein LptA